MERSCDLLVMGGGGAGLTAAVRAASLADLKVIVLEKADYLGGGAVQAGDFRVYNSRWQRERGLDDAMETDLVKVMDMTYWKLDPKLVGRTFLATGEFFDWLCSFGDDVAGNYEPGRYIFDMPDMGPVIPAFRERGGEGPGGMRGGTYAVRLLTERAEKLGVEILMGRGAADVEVRDGRITAVTAESGGERFKISCKACILATGSWINNQAVLEKVSPKYAAIDPGPLAKGGHRNRAYTGDGIAIAEKAGAFLDYDSFCLRLMGPMSMSPSRTVSTMCCHPYSLQVNLNGRRWVCEPSAIRMGLFDSGHVLAEQPGGISYAVFDQNTIDAAVGDLKAHPPAGYGGFFGHPSFPEDIEADLGRALDAPAPEIFGGGLVKDDTLEGLAGKMGVPAAALRETVAHYNECCEKGFDDGFFKAAKNLVPLKGPYYAVKGTLGTDGAFGGVLVNADMQAYKKGGGLVEGLYVAGDFASGRFVNDMGVKRQIINDLSWAFASGFIAAESAVGYLRA